MAEVITDRVNFLSLEEMDGALQSLRREVLVTGLEDGSVEALFSALDACGFSKGSRYSSSYPDLVLRGRAAAPLDDDPEKVSVELTYENGNNDAQSLAEPLSGFVIASASNSIQQITTNKYPDDYSVAALRGKPIFVEHTYPDGTVSFKYIDDAGAEQTSPADTEYAGKNFKQTGEISVFEVQKTITIQGIFTLGELTGPDGYGVTNPDDLVEQMLNHVNKTLFLAGQPREWLCTKADWVLHCIGSSSLETGFLNKAWKMVVEFQKKKGGWDETAVFVDERTGKPPLGILENYGYKTIPYIPEAEFNNVFPHIDF